MKLNFPGKVWNRIKRFFTALNPFSVSLVMVFLTFLLFQVDQVTDCLVALGYSRTPRHYIFFALASLFWGGVVYFWARIISYREFYLLKRKKFSRRDDEKWKKLLLDATPRVLGGMALNIIGGSAIVQMLVIRLDISKGQGVLRFWISFGVLLLLSLLTWGIARGFKRFFNRARCYQYILIFLLIVGLLVAGSIMANFYMTLLLIGILCLILAGFFAWFFEIKFDVFETSGGTPEERAKVRPRKKKQFCSQKRADNSKKQHIRNQVKKRLFFSSRQIPLFLWHGQKGVNKVINQILIIITLLAFLFFVLYTIVPIEASQGAGNALTVLLICFSMWMIFGSWLHYFSLHLEFPLFLILFFLMAFFGIWNGKSQKVDMDEAGRNRVTLTEYFREWKERNLLPRGRTPLILVLSEGGGIRAAAWSSGVLSYLNQRMDRFNSKVFSIHGTSGGSYGAAVYLSLLKHYKEKADQVSLKAYEITNRDYLSPVLASIFSRGFFQSILPFSLQETDHAKIFEATWEKGWMEAVREEGQESVHNVFLDYYLNLWENLEGQHLPALFMNSTQVETGFPVVISNLAVQQSRGYSSDSTFLKAGEETLFSDQIILDFYNHLPPGRDMPLSTAVLLSARFPFVGTVGLVDWYSRIREKELAGMVDGGYFDNTGAVQTYEFLIMLEKYYGADFVRELQPVILYLKNGDEFNLARNRTEEEPNYFLYQLTGPLIASANTRSAHAQDAVKRLYEFVQSRQGEFITFNLQSRKGVQVYDTPLPLGWVLSRKAGMAIQESVESLYVPVPENLQAARTRVAEQRRHHQAWLEALGTGKNRSLVGKNHLNEIRRTLEVAIPNQEAYLKLYEILYPPED